MPGATANIAALLFLFIRLAVAQSGVEVESNLTICNWAGLRCMFTTLTSLLYRADVFLAGVVRDTIYLDGGALWWQRSAIVSQ